MASFVVTLQRFLEWRDHAKSQINTATVEVTEKYARRKLGIPKDQPVAYGGLALKCIGSKAWRNEHHHREQVMKSLARRP